MTLGIPNGAAEFRRAADAFASDPAPVVDAIRVEAVIGFRDVAAALNARGIRTRRGGR